MACLDENTVQHFLEGRTPAEKLGEIDAHLATCPSCSDLVAAAAGGVLSRTAFVSGPRMIPASRPALGRGATIGRYVVLDLVGRGAMGEVYAAFDPQLNRKIALKLIRDEGAQADGARRLLREAKAIARLSHANIVVVHDAGTIDERVFIAMEFIEGRTLHEWMRASPSWRDTVDVFLAAGRGLAAAHAAGLVHRDFKPQNVMVANDGAVRVMDFGLASVAGADEAPRDAALGGLAPAPRDLGTTVGLAMTRTGALLGTPAYMAPEQFLAQRADARSDQFSFCVALYEGVYGERPFEGETLARLSSTVTTGRVREAPARARVPARLRRILLRGLRVSRDERFPSMEALLEELARDPTRRRRRALLVASAALLLLGGGAVAQRIAGRPAALCGKASARLAGVWEPPGTRDATPRRDAVHVAFVKAAGTAAEDTWARVSAALDRYAAAWTRMSEDSCEATHVRGEQSESVLDLRTVCLGRSLDGLRALVDVFTTADREVASEAVHATDGLPDLARCADVAVLRAVTPLPADKTARAHVDALRRRLAEARALRDAGKIAQALAQTTQLVSEAKALGYDPATAEALSLDCWLAEKNGDETRSIAACEAAVWAAEASRDDAVGAEAAAQLVAITAARHEDSARWAELAKAILKRMGAGQGRLEGWLAHNVAEAALENGDPAGARVAYEQAIALKSAAEGADSVDVALSLNSLGNTLHELGDDPGGLAALERAKGILERAYGPRHRLVAVACTNEGEILNAVSREKDALPLFERAVDVISADMGADNAWVAYPLTGKGVSLLGLGRASAARAPLERALAIRDRAESLPIPRGETRFALARALWEAGGAKDRARALSLATSARAEYLRVAHAEKPLAAIDAWLASHR